MTKIVSAKQLQAKGTLLREQDKHEEALEVLTRAIVAYQRENNNSGLVDALGARVLTWKHYFLLTNDKVYAILALKDAEAMLLISKEYKINSMLSNTYFKLGEIAMLFNNYPLATKYYKNSLKFYKGNAAEKGDYRYHLGEAVYRSRKKKEGKRLMLAGLQEITDNAAGMDPFVIHVWESGCHMRLADLLAKESPKESLEHFKKAEKIARLDPKLIIRRRQIKDLGKKLSYLKS